MKSNVRNLKTQIRRDVQKAVNDARREIYNEVTTDIVQQTIGCCLYYLDKAYGFRKKRLLSVIEGIGQLMVIQPFGTELTTTEILKYLKDTYDIDLSNDTMFSSEGE